MSDELVKRLEACSIEWCENMPVGYGPPINPDGPEAAARIRLLEQQLSTAREEERERCAKVAEGGRDA